MLQGFYISTTPTNLLACTSGVLIGTLVGVLPGIDTVSTIALLLPFSYGMDGTAALIMFAGIYYGSKYGRLYDFHPDERSGGSGISGYLPGWLPYGAARTGGGGAGGGGDWFLCCRHHRCDWAGFVCSAAGPGRAGFWTAGIFFPGFGGLDGHG